MSSERSSTTAVSPCSVSAVSGSQHTKLLTLTTQASLGTWSLNGMLCATTDRPGLVTLFCFSGYIASLVPVLNPTMKT